MPERGAFAIWSGATLSARRAMLMPLAATLLLGGCEGKQSTFSTFGIEAESTRLLTVAMIVGAATVTLGMGWIVLRAARAPRGELDDARGMQMILWLGAIGPTAVLAVLLAFSLPDMRGLASSAGDLRIAIDGEQFWWRVRYLPPDGSPTETANEIALPVGRTVVLRLASSNVIHSFWIPGLAGKLDMLPGRINQLVVQATKEGVYRGACAEFCGLSHARMAFDVLALEPAAFDRWLQHANRPAFDSRSPGRRLFGDYGCGGCHSIRGHFRGSPIGPDLTHFGSRRSLGAGTLSMTREAVARFIRDPAETKPGALMPAFRSMPAADIDAIAHYLMELQ